MSNTPHSLEVFELKQIELFITKIVYNKNLVFNNLFTKARIYHFCSNLPVA